MTSKKSAPKTPTKKKTTPQTTRKRRPRTPPAIAAANKTLTRTPESEQPEVIGLDGLTDRQHLWIESYLQTWNATESARRAGYRDPEVTGWRLKQNAVIRAAIEKRLAEYKLSTDEVLARLSDQAQGSMEHFIGEVFVTEDGISIAQIDLQRAKQAGKLHLVKRLSITDKGATIELYDAMKALELLGKHYELFSENKPVDRELAVTIKGYNEMLEKAYGNRRRPEAVDDPGLEKMLDEKDVEKRDLNFPVKTV